MNPKKLKDFRSLPKDKQRKIIALLSRKKKLELKQRAENSFFVFVTEIMKNNRIDKYIQNKVANDEYKELCDFLQNWDEEKNAKIVRYPREFLKSTIGTIYYSTWKIVRNPNIKIQIDSMTKSRAADNFVSVIKEIFEGNELIRELWGDFVSDANWTNRGFLVSKNTLRKQGMHEFTVVAGGLDAASAGTHVDLWIMDDLYDKDNSMSIDQVEKVVEYFRRSIPIIGENRILLTGTLWHKRDLTERIVNPATDDDKELSSLFEVKNKGYLEEGVNINPLLYTGTFIKRARLGMGAAHFTRQYLNTWQDDAEKAFNKELFESEDIWYDPRYLPDHMNIFMTVDPAFSAEGKKRRSHTGIIIYGVTPDEAIWIIKCLKIKVEPMGLINTIFKYNNEYKLKLTGVEAGAQQQILKPILEYMSKQESRKIKIYPLKTGNKNKTDRILGIHPFLSEKKIKFSKAKGSGCQELIQELIDFVPYVSDFGIDLIDAFQYITQLRFPPRALGFITTPSLGTPGVPASRQNKEEVDPLDDFNYGLR